MAYDVLQKDPDMAVRTVAQEMGLKEAWIRAIYENAPPPNIYWCTDRGYRYSLVKDAGFHRRFGYLASFLLEEKIIQKEVDLDKALDLAVITEAKIWSFVEVLGLTELFLVPFRYS
jgi:hypothetical protein